jgi:transposase
LEAVEVPSRFEIDDELWVEVEPLIPVRERRFRYPGRRAIPDRLVLNGILHVLHTGIAWEDLPQEYGYGSGVTCWRRLRDWQAAGVWDALHKRLLEKLNAAGAIDWSRAIVDGSHIRALLGGSSRGRPRSTVPGRARSTISSSTRPASRSPLR